MPIIGGRQIGVRGLGFAAVLKPSAPTSVTATNVGTSRAFNNGSATVAFTPGPNNGSPITQFTVTSSPGGYTNTGVSSPITVTGLQSNTSYTFSVTATNIIGTSDAGVSNSITATTVPQAPTIGTASGGTSGVVSVPFTANATGGSAITGFTATSSSGRTGTSASSPITVNEIAAGTYTYTVTATNANGTSAASAASNGVASTFYTGPTSLTYLIISGGGSGGIGNANGGGGGGGGAAINILCFNRSRRSGFIRRVTTWNKRN
jgi:hypothetical protein